MLIKTNLTIMLMYPDSYPTKYTAILSDFVHENM